jgi:hypothetical protein
MDHEQIRQQQGVYFLTVAEFFDRKVRQGFSLRVGGTSHPPYDSLNLGYHVGDDIRAVRENRKRLAAALNYRPEEAVAGEQVHGNAIMKVSREQRGRGHLSATDSLPATDGLVCEERDVVLMAYAADCTILFFYDPVECCIGLAHAGWRGTVSGIGPAMIRVMLSQGSRAKDIKVAFSPAIGPCCYRVGEEVSGQVQPGWRDRVMIVRKEGLFLDLPGLQRLQLLEAGITENNICKSRYCTSCHTDKFFSYRASGGVTGRMAGVISLI